MATKSSGDTTTSTSKTKNRGRNVVVCCDGTGIGEDHSAGEIVTPSNVVRIFNCLDTKPTDNRNSTTAVAATTTTTATTKEEGPLVDQEEVEVKVNEVDESQQQQQQPQQQRDQIAYYERGVGSVGNVLTKAGQGLTGYGIGTKIQIMYHWLGVHWRQYDDASDLTPDEDRLFLFGFSRGAFAVRSLQGMIYTVGLLDLRGLEASEQYRRVRAAYRLGYQQGKPRSVWARTSKGLASTDLWKFHGDPATGRIPIHFMGVFDTVGQLGMPRETWLLWTCGALCYFTPKKSAFHYVRASPLLRTGRHAVAIDEMRSTFQPVFSRAYTNDQESGGIGEKQRKILEGRDIRQVWFPGGHANVGGGVLDTGLSDGSLKWMIEEATKCGLRFRPDMVEQIQPDFRGNIFHKHGTTLYKNLTYYPRSVPAITLENCNPNLVESVHISALQRSQSPRISQAPYFDTHHLQVGQSHQVELRADRVYNSTFVYLEAGATYKFKAEGMWSGFRDLLCGPEGYSKPALFQRPLHLLKIVFGKIERGCRACSGNREARLPMTRRHDLFPWFSVMGMVASGGTRNAIAEADFHTIIPIGKGLDEYTVPTAGNHGGYLYCYANDTWKHYPKNRGTMVLTIERIK